MQGRKRAEEGGDMAKQANYLRHMAPRLKERYGAEKAQDILKKAQKRYEVLLAENKDDPPAYSGQKRERIYPSIALFHALADAGMESEGAGAMAFRWVMRSG